MDASARTATKQTELKTSEQRKTVPALLRRTARAKRYLAAVEGARQVTDKIVRVLEAD